MIDESEFLRMMKKIKMMDEYEYSNYSSRVDIFTCLYTNWIKMKNNTVITYKQYVPTNVFKEPLYRHQKGH